MTLVMLDGNVASGRCLASDINMRNSENSVTKHPGQCLHYVGIVTISWIG